MTSPPVAVCIGELLIDFVPTSTGVDLLNATAFKKAPGGAPGNVAVGLQRLGINSAFIGKVGDDSFGHFLINTLADTGVNTGAIKTSSKARTGLAFVSLKADGEREFMFYRHPSADMLLTADEVDLAVIRQASLLHFGAISFITEPMRSATLKAIDSARDSNCLISYDPNLRQSLWAHEDDARADMALGMSKANIVKISTDEIVFLLGNEDLDSIRAKLWHDDLQLLVITDGRNGCRFITADFAGTVAGFQVTALDTTGAGDGFMAGLLQGLLNHPDRLHDQDLLYNLCRFANAVGALTTTERGAIPALPGFASVQAFLARQ